MKRHGSNRFVSALLVLALAFSLFMPVQAVDTQGGCSWKQVDRNVAAEALPLHEATLPEDTGLYQDTDVVRVAIVLEERSAVEAGYSTMDIASNAAATAYRTGLERKQEALAHTISTQALGGKELDVVWNLTLAANLISANVEYGQIDAIRQVTGVKGVYVETVYTPDTVSDGGEADVHMLPSSDMVGSAAVWEAGYTGAGTRIAVIDTGLDMDHPAFSGEAMDYALEELAQEAGMETGAFRRSLDLLNPEMLEPLLPKLNASRRMEGLTAQALYRNTKVPFAFNYKDCDLDVTHDNDNQGDHGTHVSGIATANRYIPSEKGFDLTADAVKMTGTAPDAQLLVMKVFGKNGGPTDTDFLAALEDAIALGCHSVNMSLGSNNTGFVTSTLAYFNEIFASLEKTDTVVVVSAGNAGAWTDNARNKNQHLYGDDVSFYTAGSPGSAANALTVASADNTGSTLRQFSVEGHDYAYTETDFLNAKLATLDTSEDQSGTSYDLILMDGYGEESDYEGLDVAGKVVAVSRGGMTMFSQKSELAQSLGAAALIIYNNMDGGLSLDLTGCTATIPCVSLTKEDADTLRGSLTSGESGCYYGIITITDEIVVEYGDGPVQMSEFSSWGVPSDLSLKPEITAPGGNIFSTRNNGTYGLMSGTSMAAPQVAGMEALLSQSLEGRSSTEEVGTRTLATSLLMSTAIPVADAEGRLSSVLQQGAGLANVERAVQSPTYILMNERTDGKVKAELGDDPQRQGVYRFSFTVHNMAEEEQTYILDAETFTQDLFTDYANWMQQEGDVCSYLDQKTVHLGSVVSFEVNGQSYDNLSLEHCDFNADGTIDELDAQTLLERAVDPQWPVNEEALADLSGDGAITAFDAQLLLAALNRQTLLVPAGEEAEVTVTLTLPEQVREYLDSAYVDGAYVEGFVYLRSDAGIAHSIPVLGFYGSWSEPSMYDVTTAVGSIYKTESRLAYCPAQNSNYQNFMTVSYQSDPTEYYYTGNPVITDQEFLPQRNALNNQRGDRLSSLIFTNIRNAGSGKLVIANDETGEIYREIQLGPVGSAYYFPEYYNWFDYDKRLSVNWKGTNSQGQALPEGTRVTISLILAPEYYVNTDGSCRWEDLAHGAYLTTHTAIDNTAPEIQRISLNLTNGTLDITAQDNAYIAMAGLYNLTGTQLLTSASPNQTTAGEIQEIPLDLTGLTDGKFLVQVADYAMNVSTYEVKLSGIGEAKDYEFHCFDLISSSWVGFDRNDLMVTKLSASDLNYYAAAYVDGYVFASTNLGDLYVMKEGAPDDRTFVKNLGVTVMDMTYNQQDGMLYGITGETGDLVRIHKLTGKVESLGHVGTPDGTWTLACDGAGTFYCLNYNVTCADLYRFTLDTVESPELVGSTGYGMIYVQSLEWNPNDGQLYWMMLGEMGMPPFVWNTFGFMKIDPATAATESCRNFTVWGTGLYIPLRESQGSWTDPVDEIEELTISEESISILVDHTKVLRTSITPWTVSDRSVTWSSSDNSVASVDADGVVTGMAEGTAVITATSNLDPTRSVSCTVHVSLLHATIEGATQDASGTPQLFTWDLSTRDGWSKTVEMDPYLSATAYDLRQDILYVADGVDGVWGMHQIDPLTGQTLERTGVSPLGYPIWDMAYSEVFSSEDAPKIVGIYRNLVLAPKDPMNLDPYAFDWSQYMYQTSSTNLVAIASGGASEFYDAANDCTMDAELYYILDNAGYLWVVWMVATENGYSAYANYYPTNLIGLKYQESSSYRYCSLIEDHKTGKLFYSFFNGNTCEIYLLEFNGKSFEATRLHDMGDDVWPTALYRVTFHENSQESHSLTPKAMGLVTAQSVDASALLAQTVPTGGVQDVNATHAQKEPVRKNVILDETDHTLTVTLRAGEELASEMLHVSYDKELLTLVDAGSPQALNAQRQTDEGLDFAWAAPEARKPGETLAVLTFAYPAGTQNTTARIQVTAEERNGADSDTTNTILVPFPCDGQTNCPSHAFCDLNGTMWYHEYTDFVLENGLMNGMGNGIFQPNGSLTRGMLITTLYRLAGAPAVSGTSAFADVKAGTYYADAVTWGAENGIVKGVTDAHFCPNTPVTREQAATFLYRYVTQYLGLEAGQGVDLSAYPDGNQVKNFAHSAVAWAVAEGFFEGYEDGSLRPSASLTRAQMAKLLTVLSSTVSCFLAN